MIVVVSNFSKKKSFRRTKRLITEVLPAIEIRTNIGDIPRRVLFQLIQKLRNATTKGVCVKLYYEDPQGYRGFKCIEFGKKHNSLEDFVCARSSLEIDLKAARLI